MAEILGIIKTSKGTHFEHLDAVLENWGSARLSHSTQESLFVSKARLSVCLELTHKTVPRVLLHGRRLGDQQATGALECAGEPSCSLADWSSHSGSTEWMSGNLLCHSVCTAPAPTPRSSFGCSLCPCSFCLDPITILGNMQGGSPHSHSPSADEIQGGHVICPRSHFYWQQIFQLITYVLPLGSDFHSTFSLS